MNAAIPLLKEDGIALFTEGGARLLRDYVALPPAVEAAQPLQLRALNSDPVPLGLFPLSTPGALIVQAVRASGTNSGSLTLYDYDGVTDTPRATIAPNGLLVLEPTALDALRISAASEDDEVRVRIWLPSAGSGFTVLNGGGVEKKATHTPQSIGNGAQVDHPAGATHREILNLATQCTVVRPGLARKVGYYAGAGSTSVNLLGVYVRVWRRVSGTTYTLVGSSQNLKPSLVANDWTNIPVTPPFAVREGDLTSLLTVSDGTAITDITHFKNRVTSLQNYINISGSSALSGTVDWGAPVAVHGDCVPITIFNDSVSFLVIGDSLMCDSVGGRSFDDATYSQIMVSTFLQPLLGGRAVDNVALGGSKLTLTGGIPDVFNATYKFLLPSVVFGNGGINDVNSVGTATAQDLVDEVEGILNNCISIGSKLIQSTIWPFANATSWSSARETKRVDFNNLLKLLAAANPTVMAVVDFDLALDIFEVNGGGFLQFKPAMAAGDGSVHGNATSYALAAQHFYDTLATFVEDNQYVF